MAPGAENGKRFVSLKNTAARYFNGVEQNIGVILGRASGGATDVDLDEPEALTVAPYFLPPTKTFGRPSAPHSHWIYKTRLFETEKAATIPFKDIDDKTMILELRIGGDGDHAAQTVFPPSTHESGEKIAWDNRLGAAETDGNQLKQLVSRAAAAALLVRHFPGTGGRHNAGLVLGGFLARCGFTEDEVSNFVEAVAVGAGQGVEKQKDMIRAAVDSFKTHAEGGRAAGLPKLKKAFGDEAAKRAASWLGFQAGAVINPNDPHWREKKESGKPLPSMHNACLAIKALQIECSYDTFHEKLLFGFRDDATRHELSSLVGEVTDHAIVRLRQIASDRFGIDMTERYMRDAVVSLALGHCFDPVSDFLQEAQAAWDGTQRLDSMAVDHLNAADTLLNRTMVRKTMIAGVRRVRQPGCKFDNILTLVSKEGWNKSSAFQVLAGEENFSDEKLLGKDSREIQEQLAGIWIHENGDLAGMKKADVDTVKAYASRTTDRARPAYGHFRKDQKRHSIDVGTTNNEEFLQSQTGNRRFWPVAVLKMIDIKKLNRDRVQLWGEAATYEVQGESLTLDEALWPDAAKEQEMRRVKHPWEDILRTIPIDVEAIGDDCMSRKITIRFTWVMEGNLVEAVRSKDLLTYVLRKPFAQQTTANSMTLANVMKKLGWDRTSNGLVKIENGWDRGYWRAVAC